jgi:hypothetical protein
VVTRIWQDGSMWRRMVDTARLRDGRQWEELIAGALAVLPPYWPYPGSPLYHIRVDDRVVLVAEHDLTGPWRDLVRAVIAVGGEVLAARGKTVAVPPGRTGAQAFEDCAPPSAPGRQRP